MTHMCSDCGAPTNEYHKEGCDIERCPECDLQLLTCDCAWVQIAVDGSFLVDEGGRRYPRYKVGKNTEEDFDN